METKKKMKMKKVVNKTNYKKCNKQLNKLKTK